MKQTKTIFQYMNYVMDTMNQLQIPSEGMIDQKVIENVLRNLTRKFIHVVSTIE